jgi:hypothetical protein
MTSQHLLNMPLVSGRSLRIWVDVLAVNAIWAACSRTTSCSSGCKTLTRVPEICDCMKCVAIRRYRSVVAPR